MATSTGQVTKIYSLQTIGYSDLTKQLDNVAKKFETIRKAKLSTEGKLAVATDIDEVSKLADEINKLKLEEQELAVENKKLANAIKAEQLARQVSINQQRQKIDLNNAEAGSIAVIRNDIKELNALLIVRNQKGTSTIDFRGEILSIDQATAKLKQLTAAEQDFRRQFAKDGLLVAEYTSGIVQAFKNTGLGDLIGGQITKAQDKLNSLNTSFDKLQQELSETRVSGKGSLESIEAQLIDNRKEAIALSASMNTLQKDFRGTGDVGNQITSSISKGFQSLRGQIGLFALQFIGFQAAFSKITEGISGTKQVADVVTELEVNMGLATGGAENLVESLKKINTRTTLQGLLDISDVALKAGVSNENLFGITEAIDKVKVAFGRDFGSVEEGTETFVKLINIFFDDGEITADRILKIGNSIRSLANETVASVPFLTDFAGRMAGVKQISNVSLPDILGLGAGFQEFKQSAEVASTALVKIIPKLATDIDKFAKIAGITNEEFKKLLTETPIEALLKVSEGLVKGKGDVEGFANELADAGLEAGRATTIIATLGGKADIFRERIKRAGETIQDSTTITDAFERKNTNLAASFDKLNKRFADVSGSKAFQVALSAIVGLITLLIGNLPIILSLVGLLTISWAAQNIVLIGLRAQLILYNLGLGANYALAFGLNILYIAHRLILFTVATAYAIAQKAAALFNVTLRATPLGFLLTGITLLVTAFKAFGEGLSNTSKGLKESNAQLRISKEIAREAAKATSEQRAEAKLLVGVIKDLSVSEETRLATLQNLIKIDPAFQKALVDGKINYTLLNKALDEYNTNLIRSAELEAAKARQAKEFNKLTELALAKQDLETALSTGDFSRLEGELQSFADLAKIAPERVRTAAKNSIKELKLSLVQQEKVVEDAGKVFTDKLKKISEEKPTASIVSPALKSVEVDIEVMKKAVSDLDKQIEAFRGSQKDLDKLNADRAKAQAALDKALNKKDKTVADPASRLTGVQKDLFKDIDAIRDEQLARLNQALIDQSEFIRKEQDLLIQGEDGKLRIIRGSRKIRITNEERFLLEELDLNREAINDKLQLLTGANAEERKQIAELNLEKVKIEQETNKKIFELRAKNLKDQLDISIKNAQEEADKIIKDPRVNITETDRLQAQLDADKKILEAQLLFNAEMDKLEKERNTFSKKNQEDRAREAREIQQKINNIEVDITKASITQIRNAGEKQITEYQINYSKLRQAILNNDKLTAAQRRRGLEKLARLQNFTIISNELVQLTEEFKKIEELYKKGLATEQAFLDAQQAMEKKKEEFDEAQRKLKEKRLSLPSQQNTQQELTTQLSGLFGFEEDSDQAKILGAIISESFSLATDAMNSFFDAERSRIQQSLELNLQRLDIEKEQVIARAQSQAEIASLEKQYAAKKRAAEREAGEQLKKSRRAEAKVALATELANIAVAAAGNPANAVTFGGAGVIMYAILAGLALGRYALRVSEINREKFAFGGEVPTRGGKFKGKPHSKGGTPFVFKGNEYEAEVDELSVIRTRKAPRNKRFTVTGTQSQIASATNVIGGGKNFAPGAKVITHKENIVNNIKAKFGFGGKLKQRKESISTAVEKNLLENKTISLIDSRKYSQVIDRVISENKDLIETKNVEEIVRRSFNQITNQKLTTDEINSVVKKVIVDDQKSNIEDLKTTSLLESITKLVQQRIITTEKKIISDTEKQTGPQAKKEFALGGKLKDNKLTESTVFKKSLSLIDTQRYSTIVEKVIKENKELVATKNVDELVKKTINLISEDKRSTAVVETIVKLIKQKISTLENRVFNITGTEKQISTAVNFDTGGDVPLRGGRFGGRTHRRGGTRFIFKDETYNAEVDELAIIRTRDAAKNKRYTISGTQMQIASAANKIGGGIDFKPGAKLKMFETGGFIGQNLQAPVFTPSSANTFINNNSISKEDLQEFTDSMKEIANEQSRRIDRIKVEVLEREISAAQNSQAKKVSIGTLG